MKKQKQNLLESTRKKARGILSFLPFFEGARVKFVVFYCEEYGNQIQSHIQIQTI